MGTPDLFGDNRIQLKVGNPAMRVFLEGESTDIPDGVYLAFEGVVCVAKGTVIATFSKEKLFDKWGNQLDPKAIIRNGNHAVANMLYQPVYMRHQTSILYQAMRLLLERMENVPEETETKMDARRIFHDIERELGI